MAQQVSSSLSLSFIVNRRGPRCLRSFVLKTNRREQRGPPFERDVVLFSVLHDATPLCGSSLEGTCIIQTVLLRCPPLSCASDRMFVVGREP